MSAAPRRPVLANGLALEQVRVDSVGIYVVALEGIGYLGAADQTICSERGERGNNNVSGVDFEVAS